MEVPRRLVIDMDKPMKLAYSPQLEAAMPELPAAFEQTDLNYLNNEQAYLNRMEQSLFYVKSRTGQLIDCSLLFSPHTSKSDEILVTVAPFADEAPRSSAAAMLEYIGLDKPSMAEKQRYMPNTWNQLTKSAINHDVLEAIGYGMPVLTIFRPVKTTAYPIKDWKYIMRGNYAAFANEIISPAVRGAQEILHGTKSETQIDRINLHGASQGANEVAGAAATFVGDTNPTELNLESLTTQELILGIHKLNPLDLFDRFAIRQTGGAPSRQHAAYSQPQINEPELRQDIDGNGAEPTMMPRLLKVMAARLPQMIGLTYSQAVAESIEMALDAGTPMTDSFARNSRITEKTGQYLPASHPRLVRVATDAIEGKRIGHISNEHAALGATVLALSIKRAKQYTPTVS